MAEFTVADLDQVAALLAQGTSDQYAALVRNNAALLVNLQRCIERIQHVAPDVSLSPYIHRALRILDADKVAASDDAVSSAAA